MIAMKRRLLVAVMLSLCVIPFVAFASSNAPSFSGYVYDYANVISSADELMINVYAKSAEDIGAGQVIVVTVDSLQGMDAADYASQLFNSWGIGKAGINDGLLILLAPNEKRIQMATGSGIDTQITNEDCGMLLDRYAVPLMAENDFSAGLLSLTKATCLKLIFERSTLFDDSKMIQDILLN